MKKKRYNSKARQVVKTTVDDSETNQIKVEIKGSEYGNDDSTNLLVLPSKKRKTKVFIDKKEKTRLLSKAQRKKYEKIVEKKKKKENRAALLESLAKVQVSSTELSQLTSISAVQTAGHKRLADLDLIAEVAREQQADPQGKKTSSIAGAKKRKRLLKLDYEESIKKSKYNPNVVGLEKSSSEDSDSDTDETNEEKDKKDENNSINNEQKEIYLEDSDSDVELLKKLDSAKRKSKLHLNKNQNEESKTSPANTLMKANTDSIINEESTKKSKDNIRSSGHQIRVSDKVTKTGIDLGSNKDTDNKSKETPTLTTEDKMNSINVENKDADQKKVSKVTAKCSNEDAKPIKPIIPAVVVQVRRDPKVQVARLKLPILAEEQKIMEIINENDVVIIAGETGCGKTTQVPQFLYEAGYCLRGLQVGVTEPRRVAARAMAARVAHELALPTTHVSYLMRFEGNVTPNTCIKFMTDGVLLKEIQGDFLLSRYSAIIVDEAHERSLYSDILLGLLSRVVGLRRRRGSPLKLLVMSATLRVQDFTENPRLFKTPPPLINVESRQYGVCVHWARRTPGPAQYVRAALRKVRQIHARLPPGGILLFLTGQQEVRYAVRKLRAMFPLRPGVDYSRWAEPGGAGAAAPDHQDDGALSDPDDVESDDDEVEREMKRARQARRRAATKRRELPKIRLEDFDTPPDDGLADLLADDSDGDSDSDGDGHLHSDDDDEEGSDAELEEEGEGAAGGGGGVRQPLWALPLYGMLGAAQQARVWAPAPVGARLCVVATDVAETAITVPRLRYVVDSGKKKDRVYEAATGASAWRVGWASQAACAQRAGRAGRSGPGHAYRLYTSAVFQHDMPAHYAPPLCTRPPDHLVLTMKAMGIDKVVNFPFPTAPDREQLAQAERRLVALGLLEPAAVAAAAATDSTPRYRISALGEAAAAFPVGPRYGKMLALSQQRALLPYAVALVAALAVPEVMGAGAWASWGAAAGAQGEALLLGDPGALLRATGAAEHARAAGELQLFCAKHNLSEKAIDEVRKLRRQLGQEIKLMVPGVEEGGEGGEGGGPLQPPDAGRARLLRQLLLAAHADHVARKVQLHEVKEGEDKRRLKYAYHCGELEEPAFLHAGSVLRGTLPEWVVYLELSQHAPAQPAQTAPPAQRLPRPPKMLMHGVAAIEPEWLPLLAPQLCNIEVVSDEEPWWDEAAGRVKCSARGTYGRAAHPLPTLCIDYPDTVDRYRWFARFLVEGRVCGALRQFAAALLSPGAALVRRGAGAGAGGGGAASQRAAALPAALAARRVATAGDLHRAWRQDPNWLLREYLQWLPASAHAACTHLWPPLPATPAAPPHP